MYKGWKEQSQKRKLGISKHVTKKFMCLVS